MSRLRVFGFFILLGCSIQSNAKTGTSLQPLKNEIKEFYVQYLNLNHTKPVPEALMARGSSNFSKVLSSFIQLNNSLCEAKSPAEICGWPFNADPFLDAQDMDDTLNFKNSKFEIKELTAKETSKKILRVSFDLFPSASSAHSVRQIDYVLRLQKDKWVIDDLIYVSNDHLSTLQGLKSELDRLLSK